jgi:hypothetical protein
MGAAIQTPLLAAILGPQQPTVDIEAVHPVCETQLIPHLDYASTDSFLAPGRMSPGFFVRTRASDQELAKVCACANSTAHIRTSRFISVLFSVTHPLSRFVLYISGHLLSADFLQVAPLSLSLHNPAPSLVFRETFAAKRHCAPVYTHL